MKLDKKLYYSNEEINRNLQKEIWDYLGKRFLKLNSNWEISRQYGHPFMIKMEKGSMYLAIYIFSGSVYVKCRCENRLFQRTHIYKIKDEGSILVASFENYIPKKSTFKKDFSDVIDKIKVIIDSFIGLKEYSGYSQYYSGLECQSYIDAILSIEPVELGVHTQEEFKEKYIH